MTAAAIHFSRKLDCHVHPSTVHCIKEAYLNEFKKMRLIGNIEPMSALPHRKRGRPLLLSKKIDTMVQAYVRKVCEAGGGVSSQLVTGAATGCLKALDKTGTKEHLKLDSYSAHSLPQRMNFVQRKRTIALSKYSCEDFASKKKEFLDSVVATVEMEESHLS